MIGGYSRLSRKALKNSHLGWILTRKKEKPVRNSEKSISQAEAAEGC